MKRLIDELTALAIILGGIFEVFWTVAIFLPSDDPASIAAHDALVRAWWKMIHVLWDSWRPW
jgi:hypothetical protein